MDGYVKEWQTRRPATGSSSNKQNKDVRRWLAHGQHIKGVADIDASVCAHKQTKVFAYNYARDFLPFLNELALGWCMAWRAVVREVKRFAVCK
ncbi:unnamed protein product [Ceratitis capitata]|uniref:(Mediterranean fruit fly) hypothetical protein n=1 Tax=Ceratitis capitata TaxID=7213 RepID=A0A811U494_CERCA|nr:unnamed protein product [Ceratitis capitata]